MRISISQFVSLTQWPVEIKHSKECGLYTCGTFDYFQTYRLCMGAFHRSACWTWFGRGYHYHLQKIQISTDVEKKRGRNAVEAWFYPRDGHIWKSWMWLANRCRWMGGVCKLLQNRQGAAKQNLHRFTRLYQFLTRFSLRLDDTFAKWVSDILIEPFMVKKLRKLFNCKDVQHSQKPRIPWEITRLQARTHRWKITDHVKWGHTCQLM